MLRIRWRTLIWLAALALAGTAAAQTVQRLEADTLAVLRCTSGEATVATLAADGFAAPKAFTDDRVLHWRDAQQPGALLELALPAMPGGRHALVMRFGKYRTFGRFQVLLNDRPVAAVVDLFGFPDKDEVVPVQLSLGDVTLQPGDNRLALKLVGTHAQTVMPDHGAAIDWIELRAAPAPAPSTTAAAPAAPTIAAAAAGGSAPLVFEADQLRILRRSSGEAATATLAADGFADKGAFTGDRSLQWHDAARPGDLLELALPAVPKGRYAVTVQAARYRTYGIHQFLVNGAPLGPPVDMFGNPGHDIVTPFTVNLGEADFGDGSNRLGLRLVGTHPATVMANHGAGLDWVRLTPLATTPKGTR